MSQSSNILYSDISLRCMQVLICYLFLDIFYQAIAMVSQSVLHAFIFWSRNSLLSDAMSEL